ncbi:hypothetical protein P261_01219 [Lachnospiraceae bacterium TWA4]|nr:hypothetical protein P261_01219 [Lachnospiraceae bacterium TWA4]
MAIEGVCDHDSRGNMTYTEYYVEGTQPKELCDKHTQVTICTKSGKIATNKCPKNVTVQRVYMLLDDSDSKKL